MIREIKFRGKRKLNGEWIYGSLLISKFKDNKTEKYYITQFAGNYTNECEVIPETIGEYAGWKDRDSKELYEGDIVQRWAHDDNTFKHEKAIVWNNGGRKLDIKEIKFLYGSFVIWSDLIKEYRCFAHLARPGESLELLGNIHDNKELPQTNNQ